MRKHILLLALIVVTTIPCHSDELVFGAFSSWGWGGGIGCFMDTTLPLVSTCGSGGPVDSEHGMVDYGHYYGYYADVEFFGDAT